MFLYTAFSLTVESEIELPELPAASGEPDVTIRIGKVSPAGRLHATVGNEFVCPSELGRFQIRGGREIIVDPLPGADPGLIRLMLQGRLMAYLLRQRDCVPLHASGVAVGGKAVLFAGESGSGKSTTASAFYLRGHSIVTDDVGAIRLTNGTASLVMGWSGLRLLPDAAEVLRTQVNPASFSDEKHVFTLARPGFGALLPVQRIYFLEYASGAENVLRAEAVREANATALLNSNSFLRTWRAGTDVMQVNLSRSGLIAATVPVYRLIRPRALASLPRLVDLVEQDLVSDE